MEASCVLRSIFSVHLLHIHKLRGQWLEPQTPAYHFAVVHLSAFWLLFICTHRWWNISSLLLVLHFCNKRECCQLLSSSFCLQSAPLSLQGSGDVFLTYWILYWRDSRSCRLWQSIWEAESLFASPFIKPCCWPAIFIQNSCRNLFLPQVFLY